MTEKRDDIEKGEVWPDQEYVDGLERRIAELESQMAVAEKLLEGHDAWAHKALAALDEVVNKLTAERYGPSPRPRHPSGRG